jgi:hypothetical protein
MLALALALLAADANALLRQQDETLARVGYRLATSAAPLCEGRGRAAGFVVERASLYPKGSRGGAGVGALPTVTVVVPGSPAAAAGLKVGDEIAAIGGEAVAAEDPSAPMAYEPTAAVRARLDTALGGGPVQLTVASPARRRVVTLAGAPSCTAEFSVRPGSKINSYSDGTILQITSGVMASARTDAELAAVVAHELAHNILRHPQRLKAIGRPRAAVRRTEVAAERLSVYLLALAGYSLDEGFALRDRLARKTDWGVLGDGTHPGRKETMALLAGERARIESLRALGEPVRPPADLIDTSGAP